MYIEFCAGVAPFKFNGSTYNYRKLSVMVRVQFRSVDSRAAQITQSNITRTSYMIIIIYTLGHIESVTNSTYQIFFMILGY